MLAMILALLLGLAQGEQSYEEWALSVESSMNKGDPSTFDSSCDLDALLDSVTSGIETSEEFRASYIETLKKSFRLGTHFLRSAKDDLKLKLLRIRHVDGRPRALMRVLSSEGVNYHELLLTRDKNGTVRFTDVYVFATGENFSATQRRLYLPMAAAQSGSKLSPEDRDFVDALAILGEIRKLKASGRAAEALLQHERLPASVRNQKCFMLLRLMLAMQAGEKERLDAIEALQKSFPDDPSLDLVSVMGHFQKKEYDKALVCVDRIEKAVGPDAYLHVLRAEIRLEQGNLDLSRDHAQQAIKTEPTLDNAWWTLVTVSLQRRDHKETAKLLTAIEKNLGLEIADLTEIAEYAEFVKSPEYKDWVADRKR